MYLTDLGMPARAHGIGTPGTYLGSRPMKVMAQDRSQIIVYLNKETIM
jgi:hypothetical protein